MALPEGGIAMPAIRVALLVALVLPSFAAAQVPGYKPPRLPPPSGYRVYIVTDMEGMVFSPRRVPRGRYHASLA